MTAPSAASPASAPSAAATDVLSSFPELKTLLLSFAAPHVLRISLHTPSRFNMMTRRFWDDCIACFEHCKSRTVTSAVRCIILDSALPAVFSAGLDLTDHRELISPAGAKGQPADVGRLCLRNLETITRYQRAFTLIEQLPQPVIVCVDGLCLGGAVDLITACDIRLTSDATVLSIAEVTIGMQADVGTLQRLSKVMGNDSLARQWCLTGEKITAQEAMRGGLFSCSYATRELLASAALAMAVTIASHSPLAVSLIKSTMVHARDNTVQQGLERVALQNAAAFQSPDIAMSALAMLAKKRRPIYSSL